MGWLLGVWIAACAGDGVSTDVALRRGAYEKNLTQNSAINYAVISGQAALVAVLAQRVARTHPKVAKGLIIGATAWRFEAVHNNVDVIRRQR